MFSYGQGRGRSGLCFKVEHRVLCSEAEHSLSRCASYVCVCVRCACTERKSESERERAREREIHIMRIYLYICV